MPSVTIRNLPDRVHRRLVKRADDAGLSLQQYLTQELTRLASRPTMAEVLARIDGRTGGRVGSQTAVEDIEAGRNER
jgi:plasmid stability protein